jgi:hypothetical protein
VTTSERLHAILDAALVEANADKQEPRARFSNADDCERALALDFVHGPRGMADVRYVLAAACGTAVGEVLENGGSRIGAWAQQRVTLPPMAGSLDLRFPLEATTDPDHPEGGEVWDWKVVGEKSWKRIKTEPNPKHLTQIHSYCAATRSDRWVLAYLRGTSIFKDEMEWRIYRGHANPEVAETAQAKWVRVLDHVKRKTLPVIPPEYSPSGFPCNWCGHKVACWKETP